MKVLFQSRKTLFSVPGGDTIQIMKTAEYLRKLGCHVDISTDLEPDVSKYDVIHLFNLMRPQEIYIQALNAKKYQKKVALSTIYGSYIEYEKKGRIGLFSLLSKRLKGDQIEYLKVLARGIKNFEWNVGTSTLLRKGYRRLQAEVVCLTDLFLPNSEGERLRILSDFPKAKNKKFIIVPNAVDTQLFGKTFKNIPKEVSQFKGCILCVARIEGRKNQLNLVRAVNQMPYMLVLVGNPAPNHLAYYRKIKRESGSNVRLVGYVSHERLPYYYSVARVHAMPSWMETPGLSSLEAGVMGCNIVVTEKGDTKEYFGEHAFYCEPDSVDSIKEALEKAWNNRNNDKLREHILSHFTWEKVAERTRVGYEII